MKKTLLSHLLLFFIFIFFTLFLIYKFTGDKTFIIEGHDLSFHFQRFNALSRALKDKSLTYIDYTGLFNYGYATKWFYSDFLLIPFAYLSLWTGFMPAYKALFFTITVLSYLFTYGSVKRILKKNYIAVLSAFIYTFSIYRISDLFERAALGEALSFSFLPLVFWGAYEIVKGDYKRKWYILSIAFSCLIYSHLLSSFISFIILLIYLSINYKYFLQNKNRFYYLILSGIVTFFITAYFLLPFIEQLFSNQFYFQTNPYFRMQTEAVRPFNFFKGSFLINFSSSYAQLKHSSHSAVGFLVILPIFLRIFFRKKGLTKNIIVNQYFWFGVGCLFLSTKYFPWGTFPFYAFDIIQFPWRLNVFSTYFMSVAASYFIYKIFDTDRKRIIAFIFILILILISIINYSKLLNIKYGQTDITNYPLIRKKHYGLYGMGFLEYVPAKFPFPEYLLNKRDKIKTQYPDTHVVFKSRNNGIHRIETKGLKDKEILEMPIFYYKGYTATVNNQKAKVYESENGLIEIRDIPRKAEIEIKFSGTGLQKNSIYISIFSFLFLFLYIAKNRKRPI